MAPEFTREAKNMRARLDRDESELFRRLVAEMRTLLTDDGGPTELIRGRLFPNAYEAPEDEQAYRELVGDDLQRAKLEAADTVAESITSGGPIDVAIPESQIDAWLTLLTDMRLAIGTRLGVDEDTMASEVEIDDPNAPALTVMHWLAWMQEMILEELTTSAENQGGT